MSALLLLADKSGEAAKAGPIGLVVIIVLCIACYFLFKSMSGHLKKVREQWPADGSTAEPPVGDAAPAAGNAAPVVAADDAPAPTSATDPPAREA